METDVAGISELDQYLFGQGTHYELYQKLGVHRAKKGFYFAVWAPHAKSVSVVGEFNAWNKEAHGMNCLMPLGIWECCILEAEEGQLYKYCIETQKGDVLYKADPFSCQWELRPGNASRVSLLPQFLWTDQMWCRRRRAWDCRRNPVSIYEVHPGSWKRHPQDKEGFYSYREFAQAVIPYVREMGYTHVELMGILEHPLDSSWGYQVTGYFAPTVRYGTGKDFMYLVNAFHQQGIGVILDWVPAHFPRDEAGLRHFDGTALYEYEDIRKGEHHQWGTLAFDYGKPQVRNFLIASALFWIEQFHLDGLRVDAVSAMLYLDYGRQGKQWVPNVHGGNENLEAVEFVKHLNRIMALRNPGVMMIAEEATDWIGVTKTEKEEGLGFDLKWNMGWMHDFLEYMKLNPYFRKDFHYNMTFASSYMEREDYVLALSHDEVVHLKGAMLSKMPGVGFERIANLKVGYGFMIGHPGKKLLFMGQDFGQLREWSEERELDWGILEQREHQYLHRFVRDLLWLYRRNPALYEVERNRKGMEWLSADDRNRSIYSFVRYAEQKRECLLFVYNFTPVPREEYRIGVPEKGEYHLILDSDARQYGGSGRFRPGVYKTSNRVCDGREHSFSYALPAYGVAVFSYQFG